MFRVYKQCILLRQDLLKGFTLIDINLMKLQGICDSFLNYITIDLEP